MRNSLAARKPALLLARTLPVAAAAVLLLSSCSSSGTASDSPSNVASGSGQPAAAATAASGSSAEAGQSGGSGDACTESADAVMHEWNTLPDKLPAEYVALKSKPQPGGKVVYLGAGANPADADIGAGIGEAAESAGWSYEFVNITGAVEDTAAKLLQAVETKPTAILWSGLPTAPFQSQLQAAADAGIIVVVNAIADIPTAAVGFAGVTNGNAGFESAADVEANWVLSDSRCQAHAAMFGLPFPILKVNGDRFVKTMTDTCPDCSAVYTEIQGKDVGTPAATNAIISTLQADPSIKYVGVNVGVLATGLREAIDQAGIEGVKIFGLTPDANGIKALQTGANSMWIGKTSEASGWTLFDAVLRVQDSGQPFLGFPAMEAMLTTDNVPQDATGPVNFPQDFKEQFEALWLVS